MWEVSCEPLFNEWSGEVIKCMCFQPSVGLVISYELVMVGQFVVGLLWLEVFSVEITSLFFSLSFFFFFFLPCAIVYIINNTCPAWWDDTNWLIWSMQLLISSYVHILKPPLASKIHSEVTVCSWQCIKIQERSANSTCQHTAWIQFKKNLFKSFHKSRKLVSYLNTSSGYCQGFVTPSQPQWLYWNDLLKGNGCLKTCFGQQVEKTKIKT